MPHEYRNVAWGPETIAEAERLIECARDEDLAGQLDWTTYLVTRRAPNCMAKVVARENVVVAGLPLIPLLLQGFDCQLACEVHREDGDPVAAGETLLTLTGLASELLVVERTLLNLLSHLSGIATATHAYCQQVRETSARIYDTRKTLPGWRHLQKYAVRCGGGFNHRLGLYDGILLKDNHLALLADQEGCSLTAAPAEALRLTRRLLTHDAQLASIHIPGSATDSLRIPLEIEVDTLQQLEQVLPESPDIVLLDNMTCEELLAAVERRNVVAPSVLLEASGGINLETVGPVAATGVDRISVGALTHSVHVADLGMDW